MGAWIEIICLPRRCRLPVVAPYMGAWIEIDNLRRPMQSCGVAPYMGAWIEIYVEIGKTTY